MIEIIRTARSIIPAMRLRKTGISIPPYVFILKDTYMMERQLVYLPLQRGGTTIDNAEH